MYWCLHNNEILFSFLGHSDLIIDISMNPINDLFVTTSRDKTSRLWDLSKRQCICIFQDSNFASFDDSGKVIASVNSEYDKNTDKIMNFINLYNVESVIQGPFRVYKIDNVSSEIKQIKFSNDGNFIICTTNEDLILVLDAFEGHVINRLEGDINEGDTFLKADISADSKYVAIGSESGNVLIWNISTGSLIENLECHPQTCLCVKFSGKHSLLATACTNLVLWHPSMDIKQLNLISN
jgi:COMPASS component SWD2